MLESRRVTQAGSEPRIPDKPLETYHPETTHLKHTPALALRLARRSSRCGRTLRAVTYT